MTGTHPFARLNCALITSLIIITSAFAANTASAAQSESEPSALTCADFKPTPEALERFPDLQGACEAVVERNGELYAKIVAVVRRASNRSVTLYLPATDHTFTIRPESTARVLLGGESARPRDLIRGQEIRIYLATSEFAKPDIEQVALVTEEALLVVQPVVETTALPTTASLLPALGLTGAFALLFGLTVRRTRRRNA
jgi:hypothetical protein